jgi:hypothetical protein
MKDYKNTQAYAAALNAHNASRRQEREEASNRYFVSNGSTRDQSNYYFRSRPTTKENQSWAEVVNGYEDSED